MTQPVPPPLGPAARYTVRLGLKPGDRSVTFRVVTSLGELKAAAIAALRQARDDSESRLGTVEIVKVERSFDVDSKDDLLDYWGLD
jgi:hypothetical protein